MSCCYWTPLYCVLPYKEWPNNWSLVLCFDVFCWFFILLESIHILQCYCTGVGDCMVIAPAPKKLTWLTRINWSCKFLREFKQILAWTQENWWSCMHIKTRHNIITYTFHLIYYVFLFAFHRYIMSADIVRCLCSIDRFPSWRHANTTSSGKDRQNTM